MHDTPLTVRGLIPSFQLQAVNRSTAISPWHYKQRYNLVIVLFHHASCAPCCELLFQLSQQHQAYRSLESEILAIATDWQRGGVEELQKFAEHHAIPFPVLWDQGGHVRAAYLGQPSYLDQASDRSPVGVFVCDRFGELYLPSVADEADELPNEAEIRSWIEFIDMRCT